MELNFIKSLVELLENSDLSDIEYTSGIDKVKISKNTSIYKEYINLGSQNIDSEIFPKTDMSKNVKISNEDIKLKNLEYKNKFNDDEQIKIEDIEYISSNMIGTFYSKPSPEDNEFVKVGDVVKSGSTICIIESMKLMNEIKAPFDCEIIEILVNEEEILEYGQNIFLVRKV